MLEIYTWLADKLYDLLFWLENKEKDAAVARIKTINKVINLNAQSIKNLEALREKISQQYFNEGE